MRAAVGILFARTIENCRLQRVRISAIWAVCPDASTSGNWVTRESAILGTILKLVRELCERASE